MPMEHVDVFDSGGPARPASAPATGTASGLIDCMRRQDLLTTCRDRLDKRPALFLRLLQQLHEALVRTRAIILPTVLYAVAMTCHAQEVYTDLRSKPTGRIYFNSLTPKSYYALMEHASEAPRTVVWGTLHMPEHASGPVPAMVFSHGSGGIMANETDRWLPLFLKMGMAVFIVDTYGSRGITDTVANQDQLSFSANIADAYSALKLLATDPRIDPARIGQIGFSRGGTIAVNTLLEKFRRAMIPAEATKFAAHVAFYPACNFTYWGNASAFTGAPIFFALAGKDDYTSTPLCVNYAAKLKTVLPRVDVEVYEGAYHDFDAVVGLYQWLPSAVSNIKCTGVEVNIETFQVTDLATSKVYKDGKDYPGGVFGCVTKGGTVANHWSAARKAEADVSKFLSEALKLP